MARETLSDKLGRVREMVALRRPSDSPPAVDELPDPRVLLELEVALEELAAVQQELQYLEDQLSFTKGEASREQRLYHSFFECSPVPLLVTDRWGTIRESNAAAARLLNTLPNHFKGRPLIFFIPSEARSAFRAELTRLQRTSELLDFSTRIKPARSGPLHVTLSATVARDHEGAVSAIHWALYDSTENVHLEQLIIDLNLNIEMEARNRHYAEQLVQQICEREESLAQTRRVLGEEGFSLLELVHGLDAIVWRAEPTSDRYLFVNRRAEELLGYPLARWFEEPGFWAQQIHSDDREWVLEKRTRQINGGDHGEIEYRMLAADGSVLWFRESVQVHLDAHGQPAELRGLMYNISRRKKVERQIYTSKRIVADELADSRYLLNLLTRLTSVSELSSLLDEILGSVAATLGAEMGSLFLVDHDSGASRLVARLGLPDSLAKRLESVPHDSVMRGTVLAINEIVQIPDILARDGPVRFLPVLEAAGVRSIVSLPLPGHDDRPNGCVTLFFRDAHTVAEVQTRLVEWYLDRAGQFVMRALESQELRESHRRIDDAIATLAHELRNPLGAVLYACKNLTPERDDLGESREVIERHVASMQRLIEDLLDACRIGRRIATLRKSQFDLNATVRQAIDSIRPLTEERKQHLSFQLPDGPVFLFADESRLGQIVVNLLSNASKYTPAGGSIELAVQTEPEWVQLRVTDDGVGISPEFLPRIFDLFAQAERTPGGIGVGLALVKGLVELHGGTVHASSRGPGQGSEFTVRLPRTEWSVEEPGRASHPHFDSDPEALSGRASRRILVVEDHLDSARGLASLLRSVGHEVEVVENGTRAIEASRSREPQVILVDLSLPDIDGVEVARRLRAERPSASIRIAAVSGFEAGNGNANHPPFLFDRHFAKPIDWVALKTWLEQE